MPALLRALPEPNRARNYLLERENEFVDVIDVMRGALNKLAGEANAFSVRLMGSSERLNRLIEIDDIRDLKKRIADEAHELTRTVLEKQSQDELNYAKLSMRMEVLRTNLNQAEEKAAIDPLTRVANRGTFDQAVQRWVNAHRESKKPFVLAMLDRMAGCSYEYEENGQVCTLSFTASCGLAEFTGDESAEELLRRADEALYVAKRTGKNRVVLAKKSKSWWKTLKPFKRGGTDR